jgi:hypothetical protein
MSSKYSLIIILTIIIIGGGYYFLTRQNPSTSPTNPTPAPSITQPKVTITPEFSPTPTSETPSLSPKPKTTKSTKAQSPTGPTAGQISCNYTIPAAPGQFGTAQIKSQWTNAVLNKNSQAKVDVCVSANGTPFTLVATDSHDSGSRTDRASFISLSSGYTFNLYDTHGGDLSSCSGDIIAGCQIQAGNIPTPINTTVPTRTP